MSAVFKDRLPPYRVWGRYVVDLKLTEAHLFDSESQAAKFAKQWGRDCSIGWLSPTLEGNRNRPPTIAEAKKQISKTVEVIDHRIAPYKKL